MMKNNIYKIVLALIGSMLVDAGLVNAVEQDLISKSALESTKVTSVPSFQTTSELYKPKEEKKKEEKPRFVGYEIKSREEIAREKRQKPEYALYAAIKNRDTKKIRKLIEGGADVNQLRHPKKPDTSLWIVAESSAKKDQNPAALIAIVTSVRPKSASEKSLVDVVKHKLTIASALRKKGFELPSDNELSKEITESYNRVKPGTP